MSALALKRAGRLDEATLAKLDGVYRRHDAAVRVARVLAEEEDRWALLQYVLVGSERLDGLLFLGAVKDFPCAA
jgi:hypothetical protein